MTDTTEPQDEITLITPQQLEVALSMPGVQEDPEFPELFEAAMLYVGFLFVLQTQPEPKPVLPVYEYPEYTPLNVSYDVVGNHFTDSWNAERFIDRYQLTVRYCAPLDKYYVWNGAYWVPDDYKEVPRLCLDMIHDLIRDPAATQHHDLLKNLVKSDSPSGVRGMMFFLEANRLTVRQELIDADPDRVNVLNGVVNLATCEYEPPNRDRYITRRMNTEFDPNASCPLWLAHLNLIFAGDEETIRSFQMIAGYALQRKNPEQLFFVLHGSGQNGKSVTLNILSTIMGEYSMSADPRTFAYRRADDTSVRSDIARLYTAHMVTALESSEDCRLNEGLLKAITGHDKIVSRQLYEKEQERYLESKVLFATNHLPLIKDTTHGMLRRIIKIPFTVQIPKEQVDDQIEEKLLAESSGILNWLLDGLRAWHDNGRRIQFSKVITNATAEFRNAVDEYREFFDTDVEITGKVSDRVLKQSVYEHFCLWYSDKNGEQTTLLQKQFNKICKEHGIVLDRRSRMGWEWVGLRILSSLEREARTKTELSAYVERKDSGKCELVHINELELVSPKNKFPVRTLLDTVHESAQVHSNSSTVVNGGSHD